jgi:putative redox protein
MVAVQVEYQGNLHCRVVHEPSGAAFATDAPKDNQGLGESFSPTDLVAAALGGCMMTVMGIMARTLEIDITGASAVVVKEMAPNPPRRIGRLAVTIRMPRRLDEDTMKKLERAAHTCPVKKSVDPEIDMPVEFIWGDPAV